MTPGARAGADGHRIAGAGEDGHPIAGAGEDRHPIAPQSAIPPSGGGHPPVTLMHLFPVPTFGPLEPKGSSSVPNRGIAPTRTPGARNQPGWSPCGGPSVDGRPGSTAPRRPAARAGGSAARESGAGGSGAVAPDVVATPAGVAGRARDRGRSAGLARAGALARLPAQRL